MASQLTTLDGTSRSELDGRWAVFERIADRKPFVIDRVVFVVEELTTAAQDVDRVGGLR